MGPIREVESLPVLDQDAPDNPPLPSKMEGWVVWLFNHQDSLIQLLASALIQACVNSGEWRAISRPALIQTLQLYVGDSPLAVSFWEDFAELEAEGCVDIVRWHGVEYIVPQSLFGQKFLSDESIVEYQPARDLLPQLPPLKRRGWGPSAGRPSRKISLARF